MSEDKTTLNKITLSKKILIKGIVIAKSGLHIGGTNSAMSIGGIDNAIIRNPLTDEPYIPGSSLKGKMRSLIELNRGEVGSTKMGDVYNGPSETQETVSGRLFGNAAKKSVKGEETRESKQRPSRIIVRDCPISSSMEDFKNADLPFSEVKTEVVIDRITSRAMPRQIERVPAGAKFDLNLVLNIFSDDNEEELVDNLFFGLQLVQDDYLGGNGSRGSGQVVFQITEVMERTDGYYKGTADESDLTMAYSQRFKNLF